MKPRSLTIAVLVPLLAGVAVYQWANVPDPAPASMPEAEPSAAIPMDQSVTTAPGTKAQASPDTEESELDKFRDRLLNRYAGRLDQPKSQVRLLEELMRYLSEMDPEHWKESLAALLKSWFPDQGDQLLQRAQAMIAYQDFMEQERYTLSSMGPDERRDFVWARRRALFGDDADIIWQEELRNHALSQSLTGIDKRAGSPTQKAADYTRAIRETYGEQANAMLENRRQELTDRFITLSSVQDSLQELDPDQRYGTLREIRQTMGMEEAALDRWSELDRTRDERWKVGQAYQAQRQAIQEKYQPGAERDQALDKLSRDYFGDDMGAVIRDEEAAGYFRFQQPRVYGQN
ncbi:hypothetical protein MSNKSG1_07643 [Marinobacter santoriniensis NKSG1]|uniref:Lipase modulator n=1 Tax=Marinobacter santoriniensis NKSG1 TaxID=1288826 RepID=M7CPY6_9GAMM|nr:hypothetical protein [Marinobacter santoriniensis]EMP55726.1 hypothetical protein MSNKSG1_07643 [Marinobacter santoriniensis NKSG1]